MQYWDKEGNIYDTKTQKKSIVERAYNNFLAGLSNSADWINKENPESDDYKQKVSLLGALTTLGTNGAYKYNRIEPFLPEIIAGKNLFIRKPYDWMSKTEKTQYTKEGANYYDDYMVNNPVSTVLGEINFRGNRAYETNPRYMWQYPFTRYNLFIAKKNTSVPNYKPERTDTEKFDNLDVNMLGKKYKYQIRNNKNDKSKDFYNIKTNEKFYKDLEKLKQNKELYQKYLDMQKE